MGWGSRLTLCRVVEFSRVSFEVQPEAEMDSSLLSSVGVIWIQI